MNSKRCRPVSMWMQTIAAAAGLAALCIVLAGCGGSQVDKYTVSDADRKAAAPVIGADGQPLTTIKKDAKDGAAYGPDGKSMAR